MISTVHAAFVVNSFTDSNGILRKDSFTAGICKYHSAGSMCIRLDDSKNWPNVVIESCIYKDLECKQTIRCTYLGTAADYETRFDIWPYITEQDIIEGAGVDCFVPKPRQPR